VPTGLAWLRGRIPDATLAQLEAASTNRPQAQAAFGIQARNLARLAEEGVTIAMGTDGNSPWGPHLEMADMVRAGMAPHDVLVAATRNSAALLGHDGGTIESGKSADFVVLEADPLEDITNTRLIADVYLRGERVER
jgi:imidazolonepropionase-like amidohydrolase